MKSLLSNLKINLTKVLGGLAKMLALVFAYRQGSKAEKQKQQEQELEREQREDEIEKTNKRKSDVVILDELRSRDTRSDR